MWFFVAFVLSVSSSGSFNCTCNPPQQEGGTVDTEPTVVEAIDATEGERDTPFDCEDRINLPCTSDADCRPPQPTYTKPACPNVYCGASAAHGRSAGYDPTVPGTTNWNPSFYPPRDTCSCRISCPNYVCLEGTCQNPPEEPIEEPPTIPDLPPQCPETCTKDSECTPKLCSDRTKCSNGKCINPFIKP